MSNRASLFQKLLDESSSDDDDEIYFAEVQIFDCYSEPARKHGGSVPGHVVKYRDRLGGHLQMCQDYLEDDSTYSPTDFRRRYRMRRELFKRIMDAVENHDDYFEQKINAAHTIRLSCFQKVTSVFRVLTYGIPADATDEYVRIGESTVFESLRRFVKAIIELFEDEYLRSPNEDDIARLLKIGEERGFLGMLGSIDCMHWRWKNWAGQYSGHLNEPTIILEAVASQDLWIWHAFFGLPGSHNDINVLHRSPLFAKLAEGQAPEVQYNINGHDYKMGYYLADGIYPSWATFVTIPTPQGNKRKYFAKAQEAVRKDVERAFGVLRSCFAIVRGAARYWDEETLGDIMKACVIMRNMIVEDEGELDPNERFDFGGENVKPSHEQHPDIDKFIETQKKIRDNETHHQLQEDLVEHLWQYHADQY